MVRRHNEDAFLNAPNQGKHTGLWAVADGMGGHEAGDVASQCIIFQLKQLAPAKGEPAEWIEQVRQALVEANRHLRQEAIRRYNGRVIGSTVAVLVIHENTATGLWVGDSRLYRLRDGVLKQLSRDHSHVQELVDQNIITLEEAHRHPLGNVITRAVGSDDELRVDTVTSDLCQGDIFLLCTDGLNKMLSDETIEQILAAADSCQAGVKQLVDLALDGGATDNVTVAMVRIEDGNTPVPADQDEEDTTVILLDDAQKSI